MAIHNTLAYNAINYDQNLFYDTRPGLTHKHYTRLYSPARDKYSSLLQTLVNYGRESFIVQASEYLLAGAPWQDNFIKWPQKWWKYYKF